MSDTKRFTLAQEIDPRGNLEEFTSDAFLIIEHETTMHLNNNGLPKLGTEIKPGMCLIAKFGMTSSYDKNRLPNDLETLTMSKSELIANFSHMFYDGSFYVPEGIYGVVEQAYFADEGGKNIAIVDVRP